MTDNDFMALSPLLLLALSSVLIMLLIAIKLSHRIIQLSSLLLFIISLFSLCYSQHSNLYFIEPLFVIDGFSVFIMGLIIFSSLVVNILSYIYFEEKEESPKEYYVLLFLCCLGACVLAISKHFVALFLGLEILTVGLYALIAYLRNRNHAIEAGVKYLVLAAFSSAFLLFGMALIYFQSGSMEFAAISNTLHSGSALSPLLICGLSMMLVGIGFKLAIVPFHMWTADVYQGAPAPVTAFIATASKGGVFAVMLRFFDSVDRLRFPAVIYILLSIAIASMIIGNLLALKQNNVKRILAYSSIAHLGYLLVAFIPGSKTGLFAVSFYLTAYFITSLTAFGVVSVLSGKDSDAENIESYRALFWKRPFLACLFSAALISLAGIPLTVGFIGKFYILTAALQKAFWLLAFVLVLSSVVGLFYYLRIISAMFSGQKHLEPKESSAHPLFHLLSKLVLLILTLFILGLGIYPSVLIGFIEWLM